MLNVKTGYTLIEVLVGLAIISLLFTVGYAGYRDFAKRQVLNNAYEELKINLTFARQQALAGEKTSGSYTCQGNFQGYRLNFTFVSQSGPSYSLAIRCTTYSPSIRTVPLPSGITFSSSGPAGVTFNAIAQGTDLTSDLVLTLSQTTGGSRPITITKQGTIK